MDKISIATINRLPAYLRYLENINLNDTANLSSVAIASDLGLNAMVVKKDLALVSSFDGKPRVGFDIKQLIKDIKKVLGYDNISDAVVVGAGKLGRALMAYEGFQNYGINIVAAFDCKEKIDAQSGKYENKKIFAMDKFSSLVQRLKIHIGIITVPASEAQEICDIMVSAGIKGIWNFAPANIKAPEGIVIKNEDMAAGLAVLSSKLKGVIN